MNHPVHRKPFTTPVTLCRFKPCQGPKIYFLRRLYISSKEDALVGAKRTELINSVLLFLLSVSIGHVNLFLPNIPEQQVHNDYFRQGILAKSKAKVQMISAFDLCNCKRQIIKGDSQASGNGINSDIVSFLSCLRSKV